MAQSISIYQNLKQISAVLFHEIKFSGNTYLLDKDYSEDKKYSNQDYIDVSVAWSIMYDEYFEKSNDSKFRKALRDKSNTLKLNLSIVIIEKILETLKNLENDKHFFDKKTFFDIVKSLGDRLNAVERRIKFDYTKSITDQIQRIESVLGGLKSRYKIANKKDNENKKQDIMDFYVLKSNIESILERNLSEDVNMLQWVAYENQCKKRIESFKSKK